ncbi:MAG TPA: sulfotransferase [Alphaproteobacteria bacterium]|nr:sulfotransferase [Alphaproteobacteria bacterium]
MFEAKEPSSLDRLWSEARAAYQAGRVEEAQALCARILKAHPRHVDALIMQGVIAGWRGDRPLGIKLLRQAVSLRPGSFDCNLQLGNLLRQEQRFSQAIAALNKAVELKPDSASAHHDLGVAYLGQNAFDEAIRHLAMAVAIAPNMPSAHFHLAVALERLGRDAEATELYRRVIALDPNQVAAHANLGNLLSARGEQAEAVACFRRVHALSPETTLGRLNLARALIEEDDPGTEESLRRTIAMDPASAEAHWLLGKTLKEAGRFSEAIEVFRKAALDSGRMSVLAYYGIAGCKKFSDGDRPLIDEMIARLHRPGLADDDRAFLLFSLGKVYDDLGNYERAIRYYDEGNRLVHAHSSFDRKRLTDATDRAIATYTPEFFARNRETGSTSEIPVLILGMMRSGTTLAEQILSSHPKVAAGGELTFWGQQLDDQLDLSKIRGLESEYLAALGKISADHLRVTDKAPDNFRRIGLIHTVFPKARIIHCRRNPVDICLSIYFTIFSQRKDFAYDRGDIAFVYQEYLRLMAHWRQVLPPENLLEIDYEELIADREAVVRRIIAFCDLDWDESCLRHEENRRIVKTASVWQARQPIYNSSVERWRNYEPWLGEFRKLLPAD